MSKTHHLKLAEEFVEPIGSGDKNFEVRENDRGFQKGDIVVFHQAEITSFGSPGGRAEYLPWPLPPFVITYVLSGWGIQNNYVVFGIKPKPIKE